MSNARFSILQARAVKDKRISDSQFRTLAALGMYADENGWCFPSLTTIGNDLSKSKQAVGRDTIALRKLGYLEVTGRLDPKTKARRSNLYRLSFDPPRQSDVDAPSTNSVDAPSTSEVDVNDPINDPQERDVQVFRALENFMGALPSGITRYVDAWIEKHPLEWIFKAIEIAKEKGARSEKYIDKILIGWEANGYPKSREQQVQERRTNNGKADKTQDALQNWLAKKEQELANGRA